MLTLRPYQERALNELYAWLDANPKGNPIVNMCVGAGKSVVIAELCKRAIEQYPQTRIVMAVASRELCAQNLEKLLMVWPDAPAGVCSAALGKKDLESQIIFATIGSIANKAAALGRVDMLLVDECHNINTGKKGQYRKFIGDIQAYGSPHVCVIGFTGTPFRGNGVLLNFGSDPLFKGIATNVGMTELLESGHLSPLVIDNATPCLGDVSDVKVAAGDYVISALDAVMADDDIVAEAVQDIVMRGQNRKKWLVFCVTVNHAEKTLAALRSHGINAAMVTGATPSAERAATIKDFKQGSLRAMVNVACLTTGFDAPETDLIALLRPTKSPVMYVQIAGRGMRTSESKIDCLWLDYTPTTIELGPVNAIKGRKPAPPSDNISSGFKTCHECHFENCPLAARECPECGAEFEINVQATHSTEAGNFAPLASVQPPQIIWFNVQDVEYDKHFSRDPSKPPTLKVTYHAGLESITEWKCLEHTGFAYRMAANWWSERWDNEENQIYVPTNIDDALASIAYLKAPSRIGAIKKGKYWEIKHYEFSPIAAQEAAIA